MFSGAQLVLLYLGDTPQVRLKTLVAVFALFIPMVVNKVGCYIAKLLKLRERALLLLWVLY